MAMKIFRFALLFIFFSLYFINSALANEGSVSGDLSKVRKQIDSLQQNITQQEQKRKEVHDIARITEKKINVYRKKMMDIEIKHKEIEKNINEINAKIIITQQKIYETQINIKHMLNIQYLNGQHKVMRDLLNINDPNKRSRNIVYYQYINQAQRRVIDQMKKQKNKLDDLSLELSQEAKNLDELSKQLMLNKEKIEVAKHDQLRKSNQINDYITKQKQALLGLKSDERRLSDLLIQIESSSSDKYIKQQNISTDKHKKNLKSVKINTTSNDGSLGKSFSKLKKQMQLPTMGQVTGRFGAKKTDGGHWKGIFVSTESTQEVRAVADGNIVYADYLKGFGKTLILSHADGYMTIYTGLSSVRYNHGQNVRMNELIGETGVLENGKTGLYFEIRYHGKPVDPMLWIK